MFGNESKMTLWSVENKGKYSVCSISSQGKKADGSWEKDFSNKFVTFIGKAHDKVQDLGEKTKIKLTSVGVSNFYNGAFTKNPQYKVFDFEIVETTTVPTNENTISSGSDFVNVPDNVEDGLPFD